MKRINLSKTNKILILVLLMLSTCFASFSQDGGSIEPATWKVSINKSNLKIGDEAEITFNAEIPGNVHMYSSDFNCKTGPNKAEFKFDKKSCSVIGGIVAIGSKVEQDDIFNCDTKIFFKHATFKQKIKITNVVKEIKCVVSYQECTNKDGACRNFDEELKIQVTICGNAIAEVKNVDKIENKDSSKIENKDTSKSITSTSKTAEIKTPESQELDSFWIIFLKGLAWGFIAIITPCVFPMIPMTVSFFLKRADNKAKARRDAITYGISIILIYASLMVKNGLERQLKHQHMY